MPLILQPSFTDMTREQIEEHLSLVRARRMQAAMEYHAGQNVKLQKENKLLLGKIATQYGLLARDISRLDDLDNKIQERLNKISALLQETEVIGELLNHE
jgi:hypothetical protein